jgi:acyl carrier protein
MDKVESVIKRRIADFSLKGINESDIDMSDSLIVDLNLDSLAMLELLISLEQDLGIVVTDEDLMDHENWMETVGSLIGFFKSKMN